jgi:sigma-E factor negative regulatory protein RseC
MKTGANEISHKGIVKDFSENGVIVSILSESACSACHAKGMCSVSDTAEKEVEVAHYQGEYHIGQQVIVYTSTSQGFRALFLAYILPFILMMTVLITSLNLTGSEGWSGLLSVAMLIPYYLFLYLFRNKLKRSFDFKIGSIQ